jgi:voltage-gated potassium channel
MFWVALGFLGVLAGYYCSIIVAMSTTALYIAPSSVQHASADGRPTHPAIPEPHPSNLAQIEDELAAVTHARVGKYYLLTMFLLYMVIVAEGITHAVAGSPGWKRHLLYCVLPPLRMGGRDHADGTATWLPRVGWSRVDVELRRRAERLFSVPMIFIALAVLPLLGLEWLMHRHALAPTWQVLVFTHVSESLIWFAFAVEFVIMFSLASGKLRYCRDHWIDMVIICLPLIAFLRILRLGRALRLYEIAKVGRAYRLRGLGSRMFRGVLVLELVQRFIERDPTKQLDKLREQLAEREYEIEQLRATIQRLEAKVASRKSAAQKANCEQEPPLPESQHHAEAS